MKKIAKIWFSIVLIVFVGFMAVVIQTFRPVRDVQPNDVMRIEGIVDDIQEGTSFDIVITLKNDTHHYYINRGLQYNIDMDQLRSDALNKKVTLFGIKRWTIFTQDSNMGHISKLMINNEVIFNEINNDTHEKTSH